MSETTHLELLDPPPDAGEFEYQGVVQTICEYHSIFSTLYQEILERSRKINGNGTQDEDAGRFDAAYSLLTANISDRDQAELLDSLAIREGQSHVDGTLLGDETAGVDGVASPKAVLSEMQLTDNVALDQGDRPSEDILGPQGKLNIGVPAGLETLPAPSPHFAAKRVIRGMKRGRRGAGWTSRRGRSIQKKTTAPIPESMTADSADGRRSGYDAYDLSSPEREIGESDPETSSQPVASTAGGGRSVFDFAILIDVPPAKKKKTAHTSNPKRLRKPPKLLPQKNLVCNVLVNRFPELYKRKRQQREANKDNRMVFMKKKLGIDPLVYRCMKARSIQPISSSSLKVLPGVSTASSRPPFLKRNVRKAEPLIGKLFNLQNPPSSSSQKATRRSKK